MNPAPTAGRHAFYIRAIRVIRGFNFGFRVKRAVNPEHAIMPSSGRWVTLDMVLNAGAGETPALLCGRPGRQRRTARLACPGKRDFIPGIEIQEPGQVAPNVTGNVGNLLNIILDGV